MCVDLFKSVQRLRHDQIALLLLNDDLEPNVHYQKLTNWRSREYSSVCIGSLASVRWHRGEFEKPRNGTPFWDTYLAGVEHAPQGCLIY